MTLINNFDSLQNADNASGAPWFQVVKPEDVATIPDVVLDQIGTAITLNSGATAFNIMATVGTVQWSETPQTVDGRLQYRSVFSFVIPKDRADVLNYAQHLNNRGVIAIVRDANGQSRLMGTVDEPATFRMASRTLGNTDGQRNEHLYEIVLTSPKPVPFYQVSAHLPAPSGSCPPAASLEVALDDDAPEYDQTITITATPTDITPTSYTFHLPKHDGTEDVVTQSTNTLVWKVKKYGTFKVTVYATDGILETAGTASGFSDGDINASAFITAHNTATGGTMDATMQANTLGFFLRLKGVNTTLYEDVFAELLADNAELYPCIPDNVSGASVAGFSINAVDPTSNATMVGFVPSDATVNGLTGGTGKYMILNNAPSDFGQNDVCVGTYARESNSLSCQIGAGDGDFNTNDSGVNILCGQSANRAFIKCNSEDYVTVNAPGSVSRDTGWVWTQRNDAVNFQVGADGALLNVGQLTSLTPSTHVYYGMALNNAGTAARFCSDSVSAFLNCGYLDECQMQVLTEAVEWLQTQIGRNV